MSACKTCVVYILDGRGGVGDIDLHGGGGLVVGGEANDGNSLHTYNSDTTSIIPVYCAILAAIVLGKQLLLNQQYSLANVLLFTIMTMGPGLKQENDMSSIFMSSF